MDINGSLKSINPDKKSRGTGDSSTSSNESNEKQQSTEQKEELNVDNDKHRGGDKNRKLHTYNLSSKTTYEFDVIKCEDYIEDKGCWIRNMPQEIKDAIMHD